MQLSVNHLEIPVSLGVYAWEREKKRNIVINLDVAFDSGASSRTDALEDTLDYDALEACVIKIAQQKHYNLLEHMVEVVGHAVLEFPLVREVRVAITKEGALKHARDVVMSEVYRK